MTPLVPKTQKALSAGTETSESVEERIASSAEEQAVSELNLEPFSWMESEKSDAEIC